jgi:sugar lactone lactonase YvrE
MRHAITRSRIFLAVASLAAAVSFGVVSADEPMNIVTVAGRAPYTGDGGPALLGKIGAPEGLALDGSGNIYIGDTQNTLIRFVNRTGGSVTVGGQTILPGNIASVAGTGLVGYDGDGIAATSANLAGARGVFFDKKRNVFYIVDIQNHRIRKVDAGTGIISTVAGTGVTGFNGDTDPQTGHPLAIEANLTFPESVGSDAAGNIYLSDAGGVRVRRVDAATGFISTVAGGNARAGTTTAGSAVITMADTSGFSVGDAVFGPWIPLGATIVSVVPNASVTISQAATQGAAITLASTGKGFSGDGGPATAAMINLPEGLILDASENLYFIDNANQRVRFVNRSNASVTIAGQVIQPGNIATVVGGGTGPFSDPAKIGDGGPATLARLGGPLGLVFDSNGNLFIGDNGAGRIRRVDAATGIITTIAGVGGAGFVGDGGPSNQARVNPTYGLAFDASGNLVFADNGNNCVRVIAPPMDGTGIITTVAGRGSAPLNDKGAATAANLNNPALLAFDASGNLFFIDNGNNRIRRIDATTGYITTVVGNGSVTDALHPLGDGGPAIQATTNGLSGVTFDAAGNLYFCDTGNNRIREVAPPLDGTGIITTVAGNGAVTNLAQSNLGDNGPALAATCNAPRGPAFDLSGNLYFADVNNRRIRKVTPVNGSIANGTITTVVGTGVSGFSGDNGPANKATLNGARFATFDASGNLYLPDVNNRRVRKVTAHVDANSNPLPLDGSETITTVAGNGLFQFSPPGGGPATIYSFNNLRQLAPTPVASGVLSLYVVDNGNARLLKVTATDGVIDGDSDDLMTVSVGVPMEAAPLAGYNGDGIAATAALLNSPTGVAFDASGNVYIGDFGNNRIRRLNVAAKSVSVNTNADGAGGVAARVEVNGSRTPSLLSRVTLRAIDKYGGVTFDSTGLVPTAAFPGSDLGTDPTDTQAEVYNFGSDPTLLGGAGFRVEAVFGNDQRFFSGDARFSIAWSPPAVITDGTALSSAQLNATVSALGVDITGNTTITYNPPLGTVLNAVGGQALQAHFVPNNPTLGTADWTVPINVTYGIFPLYDPTKMVNSGAVIPVKLYLGDVNSMDVSSASVVLHATGLTLASTGTSGVLMAAGDANPDMDFRFDPTLGPSGGYIFNLKTTGLTTGTWQLSFTVSGDPVTHSVSFQIK